MRTESPLLLLTACGMAAALGLAALSRAADPDQRTGPTMMDFKAQLENHLPPNEAQVKTLLEGVKAQPFSTRILITEARLKMFRTNGVMDLLAEAPQCIYDTELKTVSSAGSVQIHTADQRFMLEGEGFMLQQTNSCLTLSNRVHTIIRNSPAHAPKP